MSDKRVDDVHSMMEAPIIVGLSLALGLVVQAITQLESTSEDESPPVRTAKTIVKTKNENSGLVREPRCREVLEQLFGKQFPKVRPKFLMNPIPDKQGVHHPLELDGYCEELQLAFEHNGKHHYVWDSNDHPFVKDYDEFVYLVFKDRHKVKKCRELGITLLVIKDKDKVPFEKIEEEIIKQLKEKKFPLPKQQKRRVPTS